MAAGKECMITIEPVEPRDRRQVQRFIRLPFELYRNHPLWVPPILMDIRAQLNPRQHPFYQHSDAAFFLAGSDGRDLGRIAVLHNKPYNQYHAKRQAQFYFFECVEDLEVARRLIAAAEAWAAERRLNELVGPKGFGPLDGYGMLVEGYEFRPAMTMMNYNPPYYPALMEALGFHKLVDFVSCYLGAGKFHLPERFHRVAARAAERSGLHVMRFKSKRQLVDWADRIGQAYNKAFVNNWEYYPLSDAEIAFVTDNLMTIADPNLFKIIVHGDEVVGFLFAFHDVSAAIQRSGGRMLPFGLLDLLLELRRTKWVAINGAGILPEYQGRGGNALLYSELEKTIYQSGFRHADLTQVAESAVQMRRDLENIGGVPYKNHRVFIKAITQLGAVSARGSE
jgi:GNAT superfamily N-acetyltransferase